jgi:arylsulfatase
MEKKKPNILLIVVDQMRADCIGSAGNKVIRTPTIDSIIRSGHYFSHARTEMPSCIGARRSIESGQSPERHKMIGYEDKVIWNEKNTIDHILKNNGYFTMNVGKRHNFPRVFTPDFSGYQYNVQYEEWRDFGDNFHDDYHDFLKKNDRWYYGPFATHSSNNSFVGSVFPLEERFHPSSWTVAEGIKALEMWSEKNSDSPFFMHLSFSAPHPPFSPPLNYFNDYIDKALPTPIFGDAANHLESAEFRGRFFAESNCTQLPKDEMHRTTAAYYGLISHIDACIHAVLFYLQREFKSKNILDNTIIALTGDHGEMLGDHGRFNKAVGYESAVRIPMIFNFPQNIYKQNKMGSRYNELVGNQDILPTILNSIGIESPSSVTGINLMPLMNGEETNINREVLHGEHFGCMHFLVSKEFKFIWNYKTNQKELYSLKNDPMECKNIISEDNFKSIGVDFEKMLMEKLSTRGNLFVKNGKLTAPTISLRDLLQN